MADSAPRTHWIKGAVRHPGALTRKAKAVGMTPMAFARKHRSDKGAAGRESRLAITLRTLSHGS